MAMVINTAMVLNTAMWARIGGKGDFENGGSPIEPISSSRITQTRGC